MRLISATNRDLIADVKAGRFREDLFYRLHVFPIAVPTLADRPEDIPELTRHFLVRFAAEEGKRMSRVSGEAMALLARHRWPGNVRQLENAVFRAVVLAESDEVGVTEFPQIAAQVGGQLSVQQQVPLTASPDLASEAEAAPIAPLMLEPAAAGHPAPALAAAPAAALALLDRQGEVRALDEIEAEVIRFAITHYRGQMSEVARRLQIGRSTLYRKLDTLGVVADTTEAESPSVASG